MNIRTLDIAEISPALYNPRKISDENYARLKVALDQHGLVEPLVVNKRDGQYVLVGGHQRFRALKESGAKSVECSILEIPKDKEAALNIALNNPALQGEYDFTKLADLLQELDTGNIDVQGLTGLDQRELERIATWTPTVVGEPVAEDAPELAAFIASRKESREAGAYNGEVNFWVCLVFQTYDQKHEFLSKFPSAKVLYGMYADGVAFSKVCGVELTPNDHEGNMREPKLCKKLVERVVQ